MHIHTSPRRARTARTAVAALIAAAGCWGIGTVVSKQVVDDVAPLTLLPVQLAVSCAFLLVVALVRREPLTWTPSVRRLAALGVLSPGIAYALGLIELTTITASMSVLLWALEPVVILLLAALVLRERIPPALAVTIAVAISGALLVVYQPGASGDAVGITLTLVSIGFCALYTVLTRRLMLDDSSLSRGARPAGSRIGVRGRPGVGRRASRRPRLGPRRTGCRCLAGRRESQASSTTGSDSSSTWPVCVTSRRPMRARSCRSSRYSGSRPATWSGSGSSRGSGSARSSSWPRQQRSRSVIVRMGSAPPHTSYVSVYASLLRTVVAMSVLSLLRRPGVESGRGRWRAERRALVPRRR